MKSLMLLLHEVLEDLGDWCCTSTHLDYKTIEMRVEHEGLSFLTITLPCFGKDLERALDQGYVSDDQFAGFARSGGLPRLFSGFLRLVFDSRTGRLLDEPSVMAIHSLRQACLMFGKVNIPCSQAREQAAFKQYIETDDEVRASDASVSPDLMDRFHRMSIKLWANLLTKVDHSIFSGDIIGSHGPGATADRIRGNAKWVFTEWTERLEQEFHSVDFLIPNYRYRKDLSDVLYRDPGSELPVRVISVPKTLKTPRLIAIEPVCMMFVQHGLYDSLVKEIDADDLASSLIGWSSAVRNHELALEGSKYGTFATLDLSEASDRVSNQHVRLLLRNHPNLNRAVDACRSRKADVPGYGIKRLAKFASMGSALTFPFEALVFSTVVFLGIEAELGRQLTRKDIESYKGLVRIYGDDIVVPVEFVHSVNRYLKAFGFKVNLHKSFWTGKFRESCGREFFNGADVSIVRVRSLLPTDRMHAAEIVKTVALRNHLYTSGLWKGAAHLDRLLEGLIPFPVVDKTSPVLGRFSFLGYETQKTCSRLHRPLVKGYVVDPQLPASELGDVGALLKILTTAGEEPTPDVRHLQRAGRPSCVSIKMRWTAPF